MKTGDRVNTPDGLGTIKDVEQLEDHRGSGKMVYTGRYGVLHDVFPKGKPRHLYKDDILYYVERELTMI